MAHGTSAPEIRSLADYEPPAHAENERAQDLRSGTPAADTTGTVTLPAQRRSSGQLSLRLWASEQPDESPASPDRRELAALLTAIVEVRGGRRAPHQIRTMLRPELYRELLHAAHGTPATYTLRSLHPHQPADGVVEVSGRVHRNGRALAMCARLEQDGRGWLCTEFTILDPRSRR